MRNTVNRALSISHERIEKNLGICANYEIKPDENRKKSKRSLRIVCEQLKRSSEGKKAKGEVLNLRKMQNKNENRL